MSETVDTKASADDLSALSDTVSALSDTVDTKASADDLSALSETVSALSETVDTKASADDLSALSETVSALSETVDTKASADELASLAELVGSNASDVADTLAAATSELSGQIADLTEMVAANAETAQSALDTATGDLLASIDGISAKLGFDDPADMTTVSEYLQTLGSSEAAEGETPSFAVGMSAEAVTSNEAGDLKTLLAKLAGTDGSLKSLLGPVLQEDAETGAVSDVSAAYLISTVTDSGADICDS